MGYYDPMPADGAGSWGGWLRGLVNGIPAYDIGAGGTSDDSTAVQAALNAVNSIGGGIVMGRPNTTYTFQDCSIPGSNITVAGNGWSTVYKQKLNAADNHYLLSVNPGTGGSSDPTTNITGITVRDCQLLGTVAADAFMQHQYLLNLNAVSDVLLHNVLFKGWRGDAVYIGSSNSGATERHNQRVKILGCTFDGVNQDNRNAVSVIDGDDVVIAGCHFANCTRADMPGAIDIEPNSGSTFARIRNIVITGNTFRNVRAGLAGVVALVLHDTQAAYTNPMTGLTVVGNTFVDCPNSLSTVFAQQPQTPTVTTRRNNIVVAGNAAYNSGEPFEISGVRGVRIADNQFDTCWGGANIGFTNECHDVLLDGNAFDGVGGSNGITIYKAVRLSITDNDFINAATNVLRFGVGSGSVGNSDKVDFCWNRIAGTSATAVLLKDASHTVTSTANNRCVGNRLNGLATTLTGVFAAGGSNTALNL